MPGRGLLAVACLVFIALCCISVVRKLERERRLLSKLRGRTTFLEESAWIKYEEALRLDPHCRPAQENLRLAKATESRFKSRN